MTTRGSLLSLYPSWKVSPKRVEESWKLVLHRAVLGTMKPSALNPKPKPVITGDFMWEARDRSGIRPPLPVQRQGLWVWFHLTWCHIYKYSSGEKQQSLLKGFVDFSFDTGYKSIFPLKYWTREAPPPPPPPPSPVNGQQSQPRHPRSLCFTLQYITSLSQLCPPISHRGPHDCSLPEPQIHRLLYQIWCALLCCVLLGTVWSWNVI